MLYHIKSSYFPKIIFSFIDDGTKLNLIKYNKKEINNETVSNFIKVRKKLIKDSEIPIWNKLMTFDKSSNIDNSKNKMINIFLNICSKRENKLNKLSLKFYNEIKAIGAKYTDADKERDDANSAKLIELAQKETDCVGDDRINRR